MTGQDRDDERGVYVDTYHTDAFLDGLRDHDGAASTVEVAEAVGCHRDTARRRLNQLVDAGALRRRDVGDAALWMLRETER